MKQNSQEIILYKNILLFLYDSFYKYGGPISISDLYNEKEVSRIDFDKIVAELKRDDFINFIGTGESYQITAKGILFAEENSIVPIEAIRLNRGARNNILSECAKVYEIEGDHGYVHFQTIADTTKIDHYVIVRNMIFLENLYYLKPYGNGCSKITDLGLEAVKEWKERKQLAEDFQRISKLNPQKRGLGLQDLFAKIASMQDWNKEVSVKTSNEEVDVIIYKNRDFFLVECKWMKNKIEAKVIRDFYGKLNGREGVKGIVVSMSGFTPGAKKEVIDKMGSHSILLFGAEDIISLIYKNVEFEKLLNEKYKLLITKKDILVN